MTNIPSFISGSKFSPLVLEGGATQPASGEGFVKALGAVRLPTGEIAASRADANIDPVQSAPNLVANEVDLTLPNDLGAKLLTAAGHSRPDATLMANAKQPLVTAEVQPASADPAATNSTGLVAEALPLPPLEGGDLQLTAHNVRSETPLEVAPDIPVELTAEAPSLAIPRDAHPGPSNDGTAALKPAPGFSHSPEDNPAVSSPDLGSLVDADATAAPDAIQRNAQVDSVVEFEADNSNIATVSASEDADTADEILPAEVESLETQRQQGEIIQVTHPIRAPQIAAAEANTQEVDAEESSGRDGPDARQLSTADKSASDSAPARSSAGSQNDKTQPDFAQRVASTAGQPTQAAATSEAQSNTAPAAVAMSGAADASRAPIATTPPASHEPQITAQPGQLGKDLAVKIAKHTIDGQDGLTIRLDPAELGRIHVRMHFDEQGSLRAHVTAESNVALDMLRRESFDLARALTDAGVRTDSQSFRFDSRGQENGQQGHRNNHAEGNQHHFSDADDTLPNETEYRRVRSNGAVDVFA